MKPITIVGGGLAGLALGIALRDERVPVSVFEAGHYPRHRVCGEFISGGGRSVLERLGLLQPLLQRGACDAPDARFFSRRVRGRSRRLPQPALCVSRYLLDHFLAAEFQRRGGELHQGVRWNAEFAEGCVRATGRRAQTQEGGWRWFGLKCHVRNVPLEAALEMHLLSDGYVGMTRLADGCVNVCGLFRSRAATPDLRSTWRTWLSGPKNSALRQRMQEAVFCDESFCAVAGVPAFAHPSIDADCSIGDALGMIAPLTGNGMSLAVESAALVAEPLARFSRGEISWKTARQAASRCCAHAFGARLRFAGWLQRLAFAGLAGDLTVAAVSASPGLWRFCYQQTH